MPYALSQPASCSSRAANRSKPLAKQRSKLVRAAKVVLELIGNSPEPIGMLRGYATAPLRVVLSTSVNHPSP
jgi:hypothetical protein